MSIVIFSKPVHSGKTTTLLAWSKRQHNIAGILMPDIDGQRHMYDINSKEYFISQCIHPAKENEPLVTIGRFSFYSASFSKATAVILTSLVHEPDWLVIDEIGRLEMKGSGFHDVLQEIIPLYQKTRNNGKLLLVIRNSLLDDVVSFFKIKDPQILDSLP